MALVFILKILKSTPCAGFFLLRRCAIYSRAAAALLFRPPFCKYQPNRPAACRQCRLRLSGIFLTRRTAFFPAAKRLTPID